MQGNLPLWIYAFQGANAARRNCFAEFVKCKEHPLGFCLLTV